MIKVKRVYAPPSRYDGKRVPVDRLWPRGLKKENARVDVWLKDLGPSTDLRKWFGHDPAKWKGFKHRFFQELSERQDLLIGLVVAARRSTLTLLYGSKEDRYNNAVALKAYIETEMNRTVGKKAA